MAKNHFVLFDGEERSSLLPFTYTRAICDIRIGILRIQEKCDFVICLSHLGYKYDNDKVSDVVLAKETENIDLIIGGHTHTFLDQPFKTLNRQGIEVQVTQMGWAGIWLGRMDIYFSDQQKKILQNNTAHGI